MNDSSFLKKIKSLFLNPERKENISKIEEILIEADIPINFVVEILNELKKNNLNKYEDLINFLKQKFYNILNNSNKIVYSEDKLNVLFLLGVNGAGKTTSAIKIANFFKNKNKKILLAAADTFRAAAVEQLCNMAEKINIDVVKGQYGADPASVVFNSLQKAKKEKVDFLIIDSAGRLHTKHNLMQELLKIKKVISREAEENNIFSFLVLDANTGKNMINQAKEFNILNIKGIILTKFDSTSRAGSILYIVNEFKLPIKYVTFGENINDFAEFIPEIYIKKFFTE